MAKKALLQLHDLKAAFWVWLGWFSCSSVYRGGDSAPQITGWVSRWLRFPWNCMQDAVGVWECTLPRGQRSLWSSEPQRAPWNKNRLLISASVPVRVSAHSRDFHPPPLKTGTLQASYHCFSGSYPHVWLLEHAHELFVRAEIEGREEARLGKWRRGGRREVGWDKQRWVFWSLW